MNYQLRNNELRFINVSVLFDEEGSSLFEKKYLFYLKSINKQNKKSK